MKKSFPIIAVVLVALVVSSQIISLAHAEERWVLQDGYPQVNPNNDPLEYTGGVGGTPGWYNEARFEGKFRKSTVSETSFAFEDREVDHEFEFWHVILQSDFNFDKPSNVLIPGETVNLNVNFSKSGVVTDGNPGIQFNLMGFGIDVQPAIGFNYYPWDLNFGGLSSTTFSFVVPETHGGEILIDAFLWGTPGCLVRWAYEAEESTTSSTATTMPGSSTTTSSCPTGTTECYGYDCCEMGERCCGAVCCYPDQECCGSVCCNEGYECDDDGMSCVAECSSFLIYGEHSEEVELLRDFRDNVLSKSPVGQEIIRLYYQWNPAIVKAMEEDEEFKKDVREMIDEILPLIEGKVE
jgi:hypothetical protein